MQVKGSGNFPEYVRPREGAEDTDALVSIAIKDAVQYIEEAFVPDRVRATDYYHGRPFGNEMSGRSQAQMTEVRDAIIGILPSLIRLFHGPEHVVEFVPKTAEAVQQAEQATDYVRYVYEEDNPGFLITHAFLKDGLLKKIGVVKWGIDNTPVQTSTRYTRVTRDELAVLAGQGELTVVVDHGDETYSAEVTTTAPKGRVWVKNVPPDDFFWNREARSLDEAILVGHRERLTESQLLALYVTKEQIEEFGGTLPQETQEETARRTVTGQDPEMGEENRRYLYTEAYMMLGGELRLICTLGEQYAVIKNVPASEKPFAIFCPDPEPHAMVGSSWFDRLQDAQRINSALLRGFLDSLSVSLFPRPIYVDGQASVADILNTAIGAPVRERQPGMVRWDNVPFTGDKVLPAIGMMREVVERRVGQKDGAGSLDMDALQSTGKEAVNAAIVAAQSQPELVARLAAEQVCKPMFKGIARLIPQSTERVVRLRGQYVPVNPSKFDTDMDVTVNVALGSMNTSDKLMTLDGVIADQTAILSQFGADNPVVTLPMLRNAKAKRLSLAGIKDVDSYYKPLPADYQPPPPPQPEPTPDELWIQAEKEMAFQKAMKELAIRQDELALEREKAALDGRLKERELVIREQEVLLKNTTGPHNAEIEKYKADKEALARQEQIASAERIAAAKLALEREKMLLDAETKRYAADKQAETAKLMPKEAPRD